MAAGLIQRVTRRSTTLIALESGLIIGAVFVSAYVRFGPDAWMALMEGENPVLKVILAALVCQVCLYYGDLYDDLGIVGDRPELFIRLMQSLGTASVVLAVLYFWFPSLIIGRGVFLIAAVLVIVLVAAWRVAFRWWARRLGPRERLLVVGTGTAVVALARELYEKPELGVEIVGFVDADPAQVGTPVINPGVIGTVSDIPAIVRARSVTQVVLSLPDARGKLPIDKLLEMRLNGVVFNHFASVYEEYTGKIAVENLRPSWLIFSPGFRKSAVRRASKRLLDIAGACAGLLLFFVPMIVLALAVKLTSRGPIVYSQPRVGEHGRVFTVYKYRSMRVDAEQDTGPVWAAAADARVTPIGRLLRRTHFDELPQLWNVLIGQMSLVGPRPERPEFVGQLTQAIPFYSQRHIVKPGLTGWAQVRYTYGASVEDAMQKLQYDLYYIKHMSIAFDLFVILDTIKTVGLGRGA